MTDQPIKMNKIKSNEERQTFTSTGVIRPALTFQFAFIKSIAWILLRESSPCRGGGV